MAKILLVAATEIEAAFLIKQSKKIKNQPLWSLQGSKKHLVDVLVTGIGITATTYKLTKALILTKYDLAINIGICGSLDNALQPVKLVNIITDRFGDFGAEDGEKNIDIFEMGLMNKNEPPFKNGLLTASFKKRLNCLEAIKSTNAITVQRAHGAVASIKKATKNYGKVVESMEGAAFFYVCLKEKVKCLQVRAISNKVEKRNKKNWKTNEAVNAIEGFTGLLLMELENSI
ncbi:MAG: futalosine hydrolase [Bacteroidetes bacterium]|nr:futalosine hydrolase [Bacteroidota bacterium]